MGKLGVREALWAAAGAAVFLVALLVVLRFRDDRSPADRLAARAARVDLVSRMQLALTSAAEAEKSAVMAVTDETSKTFADEARAATADVERRGAELDKRLATEGTQAERDLVARFSEAFARSRRVDDEVLRLAVANTNLKATALAFGPAADAVREMNAALSRVAAAHADAARPALGAQVAVLSIATQLPPHIAEESAAKMDEMEARMAKDDEEVRRRLAELASALPGDADVAAAASRYAQFEEFRKRILRLSRENTNVQSLALSLGEKRRATVACLDALSALREAILAEPVEAAPASPR